MSFSGLSKSLAEKYGLGSGEGLVATTPVSGLTAAALGFQPGDVVLRLNGTPVSAATIGKLMRGTPAGTELQFEIVRKDQPLVLSGKLLEKPRDLGTERYEVIYSHVTNNGERMRTIITKPRAPAITPASCSSRAFLRFPTTIRSQPPRAM